MLGDQLVFACPRLAAVDACPNNWPVQHRASPAGRASTIGRLQSGAAAPSRPVWCKPLLCGTVTWATRCMAADARLSQGLERVHTPGTLFQGHSPLDAA